ncbi:type III secretion system HrpP C-terminal domain-containing protein [Dickeya lacustris]|uniref:Type III secretion system HrpP C-terminal domain-containing protein n=1 Tax=Dickeya lacustris TaxID=2259638 RepID=A0ABY8G8L2_9GAMM|nr:type III secretion system HrpP C-terminal domain-containing protein [Dickeya lacustris]WFN56249.1 type III secretion system HrpP C-terminal domain-containing protein [Dickeya lacustris]
MTPPLPAAQDTALSTPSLLTPDEPSAFADYRDAPFWTLLDDTDDMPAFPDSSWLPFGPPLALHPLLPDEALSAAEQAEPALPACWPALASSLTEMPMLRPGEPLSFSLQLPQLGHVDVRMLTRPAQGWEVSLRFGKRAYEQLKGQRDDCRRSLAGTLRAPVLLQFDSREDDE